MPYFPNTGWCPGAVKDSPRPVGLPAFPRRAALQGLALLGLLPAAALAKGGRKEAGEGEDGAAQTVTLVAAPVGSGELAMAADLAEAVDGAGPRLLVLVGEGGERNLADLAGTRGVDMALASTVDLRRARAGEDAPRLVYVAKLHAAELHVLAREGVRDLTDLDGKDVCLGRPGGSTEAVAAPLLAHYGIRANALPLGPREALGRLREPGGPAAALFLTGKPAPLYGSAMRGAGLHFLPVPYDEGFDPLHYPAALEHADYPDLVEAGARVPTVAVSVALAAFDWAATRGRHERLARFTKALVQRVDRLGGPGHHPKWAGVNLAGAVEGWRRFGPAEAALTRLGRAAAVPVRAGP